jgi:hypothetical protein
MSDKYNCLDAQSFKGHMLIDIRNSHINETLNDILNKDLIPKQYINETAKIESDIQNNKQQTQTQLQTQTNYNKLTIEKKHDIVKNNIRKECLKDTAKLIIELALN